MKEAIGFGELEEVHAVVRGELELIKNLGMCEWVVALKSMRHLAPAPLAPLRLLCAAKDAWTRATPYLACLPELVWVEVSCGWAPSLSRSAACTEWLAAMRPD